MKALAIASGIVFWTLVLGGAYLAFFPGSSPEPVVVLQIEPAAAPGTETPAAADQTPDVPSAAAPAAAPAGNVDVPPGFAVAPPQPEAPAVDPQDQGTMLPMVPGGPNPAAPAPALPQAAPEAAPPAAPDHQGATPEAGGTQQAAAAPSPQAPEGATGSLPSVPVQELVEDSQYGPLPKIASDGRRPIDVYARPSRYAAATPGTPPRIAVLVVGLGLPDSPPNAVLKGLPAPVSVAYGAYGRSLQDAVTAARAEGHEVLLQIPLEPQNYPTVDPGPHTLLTTLPPADNIKRLQWLMSRYTGYVGITNLMGGKFEASAEALEPVLEEAKRRGLLYIDAEGAQDSAVPNIAKTIGLDFSVASVQIDTGDPAQQLAKLEQAAKQHGSAIGVAHAKPATIKQLSDWAAKLESKGFVLVPVSAAVRSQAQG
jgi:uncharacterized protein